MKWNGRRMLVVAPHPDDDVIACGGTIARAHAEGAALRVLYVTDGAASHRGSRAFPPERIRALRENEALEALRLLGVPAAAAHFMRERDALLECSGPAAHALATRFAVHLREFAPSIVFSPSQRDGHGDHRACSHAVRRAFARANARAALYEYVVWPAASGAPEDTPRTRDVEDVAVEIGAYRARKARALAAHRSQLGQVIDDAEIAFVLPAPLLRRAEAGVERFFRIPLQSPATV